MIKNLKNYGTTGFNRANQYFRNARPSNWVETALLVLFAIGIGCFVTSIFAFLIFWPLLLAWAINLLFGTAIPYTFGTWLAIIVVTWFISSIRGGSFIKITTK